MSQEIDTALDKVVAAAKVCSLVEFEAWLTERTTPLALEDWEKSIGIARARIALAVLREFRREQASD